MLQKDFTADLLSNEALQELFQQDLLRIAEEEELSHDRAFLRVCIEYLGLDPDLGVIADGKGDYGVDYIEVDKSGVSIIQSKSVEFETRIDFNRKLGTSHITDLPRIKSLFENLDELPPRMNTQLKQALMDVKHHIRSLNESQKTHPFHVTVYFCAQAAGLTEPAMAEFSQLGAGTLTYGDCNIEITYLPVFLNDLLETKWSQSNTKWTNKKNQKRERFQFDICGTVIRDSSKACVFFAKASQLVQAYNEIGYQIFESNVRCEIKNSSVNKAIKASLRAHRGREEFKHLNNGITIICDNFQYIGPRQNTTSVRITRPGIINGLQTIKTLADFVSEDLSNQDLDHFNRQCQILTRVHAQNSVKDYRDLVRSTNNQNPMKPRNLKSNDTEQILLERYFSDILSWFYERKEGAWNAFKADPARWSTINRKPQHFIRNRIIRKVDNEEIAQAWLAYIGFSEQAVDQKRYLFSAERKYYELIFLTRTSNHGNYYNHRPTSPNVMADAIKESPTGEAMLTAYLVREFAKSVVKTRKENRDEAVSRLQIATLSRADQEAKLAKDREYLKDLVLRSMLLLFVEFFGYVMFSAFGKNVHSKFRRLLENGSLCEIYRNGDLSIVRDRVRKAEYEQTDILIHVWELYSHCVSQMLAGAWLRERHQASNISKFTYSERTRQPLYDELGVAEGLFKDQLLIRKWSIGFNKAGGVDEYIRANVE